MGDIADAMLDGDLCESCGSAIEDETIGSGGFPVLCAYCWLDLPEAERKNRPHERVSVEDRAFHKHLHRNDSPTPRP